MEIVKTHTKSEDKNYTIIQFSDESIGLTNLAALKNTIKEEISLGNNYFIFDLKNINSINSSGLGIFISCLKDIKSASGTLKIINVNEKVFNIFKITKLHTIFEIEKI